MARIMIDDLPNGRFKVTTIFSTGREDQRQFPTKANAVIHARVVSKRWGCEIEDRTGQHHKPLPRK